MRGLLAVGLLTVLPLPAIAAPPAYLDDRSTAASLVKSFYNAIDRHEYARAYSYFAEGAAPKRYAQFAAGYADTASVRVLTGRATSEGAAGSTYTTVTVAIDALSKSGRHRQYAGCYTTRLADPAIQEPPVVPMVIFRAQLHAAFGSLASLLGDCAAD